MLRKSWWRKSDHKFFGITHSLFTTVRKLPICKLKGSMGRFMLLADAIFLSLGSWRCEALKSFLAVSLPVKGCTISVLRAARLRSFEEALPPPYHIVLFYATSAPLTSLSVTCYSVWKSLLGCLMVFFCLSFSLFTVIFAIFVREIRLGLIYLVAAGSSSFLAVYTFGRLKFSMLLLFMFSSPP